MNRFVFYLALILGQLGAKPSPGAEFKLLPEEIVLTGRHANQKIIAVNQDFGKVVTDLSPQVKFTSSNSAIAQVDAHGKVQAVSDGEATITASANGKQTTAKVKVVKVKDEFAWSFRNHVIPLLTKQGCNSGACHGALAGKGGMKLSLRGYNPEADYFVLTQQALGRRVDQQAADQSLFLLKPTRTMPHGGGKKFSIESDDYRLLLSWIQSGAPGPKDSDVRIERIEVMPSQAILKPEDNLQVIVRAWYSDGHSEDVTRWAKFSSSEDLIAAVDGEGKVHVAGNGEAAITVWYSNKVAAARITSPMPNQLDAKVFATAPRNNFIDNLVLNKLEALRIPPSPPCTDSEFIRRAYLDAAGILPTVDEVKAFLNDQSSDKRDKLIDSLLERPEFVDYWTYKWSDMLLISSRKLSQPSVWSFFQFVRQSVADNKPWDRFAKEILTAKGNTQTKGAANYFVLHKDVTDLTEATSVTFLGMSITCCRCHNHPLEKWTQDQYWSMANLFSRVSMKNGDRAGEISVQPLPSGDVLHPRKGIPMAPAPLDAKPLPLNESKDRREYFAAWLTAPDNPYFAKAIVNRVWRNFMGRGLVEAEDDLRQTNPPTNPELLDALAKDCVEHQYDVKHVIRTIMRSASYQRSSKPLPENSADDRFYSHYLVRRLSAEVMLDAYSQVTGVPTAFTELHVGSTGGTSGTNQYPLGTRAMQLPDSLLVSNFLDSFGRPLREQTCSCERQQDSSVTQALHLNNGKTLNDKLRSKDSLVEKWLKDNVSNEEATRRVFQAALSRDPTSEEVLRFEKLLAEAEADKQTSRREVLEDLFWAVLSGREFLFNH
jgi:hypothetical protein